MRKLIFGEIINSYTKLKQFIYGKSQCYMVLNMANNLHKFADSDITRRTSPPVAGGPGGPGRPGRPCRHIVNNESQGHGLRWYIDFV